MIKSIIFDCFGVLYRGSLGYLYEIVPEQNWAELRDASHAADYGYIEVRDLLEIASKFSGKPLSEIVEVTNQHHIKNDKLVSYIREELKPHYKIGLLSNVGRDLMDKLFTKAEQDELFDAVVLSSDVGITKPSADIYKMTADRLGSDVEECVMIDDVQANIDGASVVGMPGIVYYDTGQMKRELASLGVGRA